jgi:acyl-coenzyme A thioesterase PaaI-like protein
MLMSDFDLAVRPAPANLVAAAKPGPLVCKAEVVRLGKRLAFLEGRLIDGEERVLVRATSSALLVPLDRATEGAS